MRIAQAAAALLFTASIASAGVWTTTYNDSLTGFGPNLNAVIAGSAGISNANMEVARNGALQVGLKAHERFVGDLATSAFELDRYIAQRGADGAGLASWNLTFGIDFGAATLADYTVTLIVDFDPSAAAPSPVVIDLSALITAAAGAGDPGAIAALGSSTFGGSENLGFDYWSTLFGQSFDPKAVGEYDISVLVSNTSGLQAMSDITVAVVPLPPAAFAGIGLLVTIAGYRVVRSARHH